MNQTGAGGHRMNILFLTLIDFRSINENNIYTDLLREFIRDGHSVYAISPVERRRRQKTTLIAEPGCQILKLKIGNIQKTNLLEKGLSTLSIEPVFLRGIKRYFADVRFDLVLYSTPPITLLKVVAYVRRRDQARTYLLLKDIFPQNAVDLGMLSRTGPKGLLYRYFRRQEKQLYALFDHIGCMSPANVRYLLSHNPQIKPEIVEVCPNCITPRTIVRDEAKSRAVKAKYGIPADKVVFVYGGNLGKPQGVDFLMRCLAGSGVNPQAHFLIVGSGTEYGRLQAFLQETPGISAQLFASLPRDDYDNLVNSCDVGLIFLDHRFTIPNFPSRILSYMQASIPVLAATDGNTDIGGTVVDGEFGFWCASGDLAAFNQAVGRLCAADLRSRLGANARRYLEDHYTARHAYQIIRNHFPSNQPPV